MKTYESMKSSSVFWLGMIPEHWEERFLEQTCHEKCIKNIGNTESNVLSLSYGYIIKKKNVYSGLVAKDFSTYQIVQSGDIILRFTDLQNDHRSLRTGLVTQTGIITSAYTCITPTINSAYLHYLLHAYDLQKVFYGMGGGVRQSIGYKDVRHMTVLVPPREEQEQIVRFLDWKVSEINRLINIKRKEIERLEELKKAVVSYRLSGEKIWLKRLLLTPLQYGANSSGTVFNSKLPRYVRITDIDSKGQLKNEGMKSIDTVESAPYILENGDVLLARSGATVGKAFMYKPEHGLCAFAGYLIRAKLNTNVILPKYFLYFTESLDYSNWKDSVFIQATIQNISAERYNKLPVPVPSIEEQKQIVTYLDEQTKKINIAIANKQQQIQIMQELKTRLISDVVTGKTDVRGIRIPEYEYTAEESDKQENEI